LARAKAQIVSLDLIISVVLLMLFIGVMLILLPSQADASQEYSYANQIFTELEKLGTVDPPIAFYSNYRIDNTILRTNVVSRQYESNPFQDNDLKFRLIGATDFYSTDNDVCIFFLDSTTVQPITAGQDAIGLTYDSSDHNTKSLCDVSNPCQFYSSAHAFSKPVLRSGRVVNMFIVICEA
jgi:hypothetical protein